MPEHTGTQLFRENNMGHNYLEQNMLGHSFEVLKCTRVQLFRTKNSGKQLFRGKIYWGTAI